MSERQRTGSEGPEGHRPRRRVVIPVVGSTLAVAALFIGVFPTRALLDQRAEEADADGRLAVLEVRNQALEDRVEALGTDEELERLAREQYGLVYPGEESYGMLPAPEAPLAVPDAWPFRALHDALAEPSVEDAEPDAP